MARGLVNRFVTPAGWRLRRGRVWRVGRSKGLAPGCDAGGSSVTPALRAVLAPESTQALRPLIWLTGKWTSSSGSAGVPSVGCREDRLDGPFGFGPDDVRVLLPSGMVYPQWTQWEIAPDYGPIPIPAQSLPWEDVARQASPIGRVRGVAGPFGRSRSSASTRTIGVSKPALNAARMNR